MAGAAFTLPKPKSVFKAKVRVSHSKLSQMLGPLMKIHDRSIQYLIKVNRLINVIKVIGPIAGAALIAMSQFNGGKIVQDAGMSPTLALSLGIALSLLGGVALIMLDQNTPQVLAELLRKTNELEERVTYINFLDKYQDSLLSRISLNSVIREVVETAINKSDWSTQSLSGYCNTILDYVAERKSSLFDIGDEYWNFSIYHFDECAGELHCLSSRREKGRDPGRPHRSWPVGEGHVGLTFSRAKEIIFSDATRPEILAVIGATDENARDHDTLRYRSLASIPISTDGRHPLGVLIATSDTVGRFLNAGERSDTGWDREDALREVAAFLAILFQAAHSKTKQCSDEQEDPQDDRT